MPGIAGALPTIGKAGAAGSGIMGVISNIIRGNRVNDAQKQAIARQKELSGLISNPALLAQKVQSMEQPLNQGLVQGVENQAQGGLAERGLGTSPQIANEVFAQALGPYEQQNRSEALRSILQMYGMDESMLNSIIGMEGQPTDTSGFWNQLQGKGPSTPYQNTNFNKIPSAGPDPAVPGLTVPGAEGGDFPGLEGLF